MEEYKAGKLNEFPKDLFKEDQLYEAEDFLARGTVQKEAFFALAQIVAQNKQELFGTYHNLFSSQKEKSKSYIQGLVSQYENDLKIAEHDMRERLEQKIRIANAWIEFLEKHTDQGWTVGWNTKSVLEECLK